MTVLCPFSCSLIFGSLFIWQNYPSKKKKMNSAQVDRTLLFSSMCACYLGIGKCAKEKRNKMEGRRSRVLGALSANWTQTSNSCSLKTSCGVKSKSKLWLSMWLNRHPSKLKSIICLLIYEGVYALDRHTLFLPPVTFFSSQCMLSFGKLI